MSSATVSPSGGIRRFGGIRRQPDMLFRDFAAHYLDASKPNKTVSSDRRDREVVAALNRYFGGVLLHELTAHRIEQFKRERLAGGWRARGQKSAAKPVRPATVNRELDTLRAVLSWAVKERKLIALAGVDRLHVDNRRIRVLSPDEQLAVLRACQRRPKLAALLELLLITGARVGELLDLQWTEDHGDELHFLNTKNGQVRRVQVTARMRELLDGLPRRGSYVFMNARTGTRYQNIRKCSSAPWSGPGSQLATSRLTRCGTPSLRGCSRPAWTITRSWKRSDT